jgi:hypothetical protein
MGKTAIKSVHAFNNALGRSVAVDGHVVPNNSQNFGTLAGSFDIPDGHMVPAAKSRATEPFLTAISHAGICR